MTTSTTALFKVRQAVLPILSHNSITKKNLVFPVHRIYCVGRNYRDHAIEMGHNPDREPPFFFHKPADVVSLASSPGDGAKVPFATQTSNLHYEAELVVAIGKESSSHEGAVVEPTLEEASDLIYGYSVGCDLTRRDLQDEAKSLKRPWDTSKGFDYSAPMTAIVPKEDVSDDFLESQDIRLWVNDELKQSAPLSNLIWSVPETIQYLSRYYRLLPGDLIMTGTPAGVGPLAVGDDVRISCGSDLPECRFEMVDASSNA
jgi:fumarylpyruvate hydrolase